MLPNPLTICAKDDGEKLPRITDGEAYVVVIRSDGVDSPEGKPSLLVGPEGGIRQTLDSSLSAHFSVKVQCCCAIPTILDDRNIRGNITSIVLYSAVQCGRRGSM